MKGKKIVAIDLWQCFVAEKEGKKIVPIDLWEKKNIMAMELSKIGGERERERERENCPDKKKESITSHFTPDSILHVLWNIFFDHFQ